MARFRDHNDVVGNVEADGDRVVGEVPAPVVDWTPPPPLAQYNGSIVGTVPSITMPTVEEALRAHSRNLDASQRPPLASARFHTRSLRRFA
jgi:hypothetical protein